MKYFTAELYQQFNSTDIDVADKAADLWEESQKQYEERLEGIRSGFSNSIRQLSDKLCLHDARLISLHEGKEAFKLLLLQNSCLFDLSYKLLAPTKKTAQIAKDPFSANGDYWLYDEVDMPSPGRFTHQILFSNGREFTIEFSEFHFVEREINPVGTRSTFQHVASIVQSVKSKSGKTVQVKLSKELAKKMNAVNKRMSQATTTSTEFEFNPMEFALVKKVGHTQKKKQANPVGKERIRKQSSKP